MACQHILLVTVRNSLQPAYLVREASHAGAAAEVGEMEKDARHDTFVTSTGSKFEPLVVGLHVVSSQPPHTENHC